MAPGRVAQAPVAPAEAALTGTMPPGYVVVARRAELLPGALRRVQVGDVPVVLVNFGSHVYALADTCLHRGAPLSQGRLCGGGLVCPWHAWVYDLATGAVRVPRGVGRSLTRYSVWVAGDLIAIGPPVPTAGSEESAE